MIYLTLPPKKSPSLWDELIQKRASVRCFISIPHIAISTELCADIIKKFYVCLLPILGGREGKNRTQPFFIISAHCHINRNILCRNSNPGLSHFQCFPPPFPFQGCHTSNVYATRNWLYKIGQYRRNGTNETAAYLILHFNQIKTFTRIEIGQN